MLPRIKTGSKLEGIINNGKNTLSINNVFELNFTAKGSVVFSSEKYGSKITIFRVLASSEQYIFSLKDGEEQILFRMFSGDNALTELHSYLRFDFKWILEDICFVLICNCECCNGCKTCDGDNKKHILIDYSVNDKKCDEISTDSDNVDSDDFLDEGDSQDIYGDEYA